MLNQITYTFKCGGVNSRCINFVYAKELFMPGSDAENASV